MSKTQLEQQEHEQGKRRTLWMPKDLDAKAEETRKLLGLGRSGFYRYCIIEVIKEIISKNSHQEPIPA